MWYDKSMNYVFDKLEVVFEVWGFYVFGVINDEIKIKFCFVNWKKKKKRKMRRKKMVNIMFGYGIKLDDFVIWK